MSVLINNDSASFVKISSLRPSGFGLANRKHFNIDHEFDVRCKKIKSDAYIIENIINNIFFYRLGRYQWYTYHTYVLHTLHVT